MTDTTERPATIGPDDEGLPGDASPTPVTDVGGGSGRAGDTIVQPRLSFGGWLRWVWRQLTSMRTALMLLLALAVAAVPGAILPQRSIDPGRTADWIGDHSTTGPVLDRLSFFEVYASPWFAAIYLLLFISLVGCLVPRTLVHWRAIRSTPPRAPRRLERLPAYAEVEVAADPDVALKAARTTLRRRRFRVHSHDAYSLSAEGGLVKETGNLVFHLSLVGVIIGVALGHLFGWKGDVILPEGQTFANTPIRYDTPLNAGPWVDPSSLRPFTIKLDKFDATFEQNVHGKGQFGSPRDFTAYVTTADRPGAATHQRVIRVNGPLSVPGATAFLLGNGYAPRITVRDGDGVVVYREATPFLARDNNYTSVGAVKVPSAEPKELGFSGFFLPTGVIDATGPHSIFPQTFNPELALTLYEGTLNPDGRPQSVYSLDLSGLTQVKNAAGTDVLKIDLKPGETVRLPGGRGSITFDGVDRFAGLSIRHDPGKWLTLVSALLALAGLVVTLVIRRRRVFVRVSAGSAPGRTLVSVGGLAKDDDVGLPELVSTLAAQMSESIGARG